MYLASALLPPLCMSISLIAFLLTLGPLLTIAKTCLVFVSVVSRKPFRRASRPTGSAARCIKIRQSVRSLRLD